MGTIRRAKGTGTIKQEGRGWSLRIKTKGRSRYVPGLASREEAEAMARTIAGQEHLARLVRAATPSPTEGDPYAWAEARWPEMNPRERQAVVFAHFGGRCVHCGRPVTIPTRREVGRPDRAVLDHRIPISGGGADSFANVVLSCQGCNARKLDEAAA